MAGNPFADLFPKKTIAENPFADLLGTDAPAPDAAQQQATAQRQRQRGLQFDPEAEVPPSAWSVPLNTLYQGLGVMNVPLQGVLGYSAGMSAQDIGQMQRDQISDWSKGIRGHDVVEKQLPELVKSQPAAAAALGAFLDFADPAIMLDAPKALSRLGPEIAARSGLQKLLTRATPFKDAEGAASVLARDAGDLPIPRRENIAATQAASEAEVKAGVASHEAGSAAVPEQQAQAQAALKQQLAEEAVAARAKAGVPPATGLSPGEVAGAARRPGVPDVVESLRPAKAAAAKTGAVAAEPALPAFPTDLRPAQEWGKSRITSPWHEMSVENLRTAEHAARAEEDSHIEAVFGKDLGAKYRRYERQANSTTSPDAADRASAAMKEMEKGLTPEQLRVLDGDQTRDGWETISAFRNAKQEARNWADSPENLGRGLSKAIIDVGHATDPAEMDFRQLTAYAKIKEAHRIAEERGWDTAQVTAGAINQVRREYGADADEMLDRWITKAQPEHPVAPEPLALPAPDEIPKAVPPKTAWADMTKDEKRAVRKEAYLKGQDNLGRAKMLKEADKQARLSVKGGTPEVVVDQDSVLRDRLDAAETGNDWYIEKSVRRMKEGFRYDQRERELTLQERMQALTQAEERVARLQKIGASAPERSQAVARMNRIGAQLSEEHAAQQQAQVAAHEAEAYARRPRDETVSDLDETTGVVADTEPNPWDVPETVPTSVKDILKGEKGAITIPHIPPPRVPERAKKIGDELRGMFAAETRGPGARRAHEILTEGAARLAAKDRIVAAHFRDTAKLFDAVDLPAKRAFYVAYESGLTHNLPLPFRAAAQEMKKVFETRFAKLFTIRDGEMGFIEHYLPHIYENPQLAAQKFEAIMRGRRPLQGTKFFLKQRSIPTIEEALNAGLKLKYENPIDALAAYAHQVDKYVMANELRDNLKSSGLLKFFRTGQRLPDGWAAIDDNIFRVRQYSQAEKGMIERGQWAAPEPAARVVNNYLAPGLKGSAIYDSLYSPVKAANMAHLALSAFHVTFETINSMAMHRGIALEEIMRGQVGKGMKRLLTSATPYQAFKDYALGKKALKSLKTLPLSGENLSREIELVIAGGGRTGADTMLADELARGIQSQLGKGNYAGASWQVAKNLLDISSAPIMRDFVPKVKLGGYLQLVEHELAMRKPQTMEEVRTIANQSWQHIDNLFGQVVGDNLSMNKNIKHLLDAVISFPGWNIGSLKHYMGVFRGGAKGANMLARGALRKAGANVARGSIDLNAQFDLRYATGLVMQVATAGTVYSLATQGKWPEHPMDYFRWPTGNTLPNGRRELVQPATYLRDFNFFVHPVDTVSHKLSPIFSWMSEGINNMDYAGVQIRNPKDSAPKQAFDFSKHMAKSLLPFTIQNYMRAAKKPGSENQGLLGAAAQAVTEPSFYRGLAGLSNVPRQEAADPLEAALDEAMKRRPHIIGQSREDFEAKLARRDLLNQARAGERPDVSGLDKRQRKDLRRRARMTALQDDFNRLGLDEAVGIFPLGDAEQKKMLLPQLRKMLRRSRKPEEKRAARPLIRQYMDEVRALP